MIKKTSAHGKQWISWHVRIVAPIPKMQQEKNPKKEVWGGTCHNVEHPTHGGPQPPWNTLLTVGVPHGGTPHSPWTCPTAEHPTHHGPAPPRKTLLTVDMPHSGTTHQLWTCPTVEHPTHHGPASPQNTLLTVASLQNTLFTLDRPTWDTLITQWKNTFTIN